MKDAVERGLSIQIKTILWIASILSFIITLAGGWGFGRISAHETDINSNIQRIVQMESALIKLEDVTKILHGHSIHFKNMIESIKEIKDKLK